LAQVPPECIVDKKQSTGVSNLMLKLVQKHFL